MSEVQSRPARGRSTARGGGRGGHGFRGPRSSKHTNGEHATSTAVDILEDEGELAELKKRYQSQISTLKELFPDWADVDLLLAIEESDGDLPTTIEKISEGNVSQFSEVKKAKDRSRSKVKDAGAAVDGSAPLRGNRGRGSESVRGRGRGSDRGRGGFRGSRGGPINGARTAAAPSIPTTESPAWGETGTADAEKSAQSKDNEARAVENDTSKPIAAAAAAVTSAAQKTWASMFAPVPKAAAPKPALKSAPSQEEPPAASAHDLPPEVGAEELHHSNQVPIPPVADEIAEELPAAIDDASHVTPNRSEDAAGLELAITPSKDELTVDNVEHLPDETHGPPTETVASTVASSKDIGTLASVATPLSSSAQAPIGRPAIGGFATSALKATSGAHRSASFQRRLQEQQEAVVMPGKHAVNQAAVQFGSLGLNADADTDNLDVDEDREDAETRTQPPQHSPVQPRASLPPVPRQAQAPEIQQQETPTQKPAPGLPSAPQQQSVSQHSPPHTSAAQAMQSQSSQSSQPYNQFGRYGQGGLTSESQGAHQKSYDPFGQHAQQSNQYEYSGQQQSQQHNQQHGQQQSNLGAFSSAPDAFASQYLTSDQQRSAYQQYYQGYGQQAPSQQEAGNAQQRAGSGFGGGPADSSYSQSQQQQGHGRYSETQDSGHNTPNPVSSGQHPSGTASQQAQHPQQGHGQPGQHTGNYPYNHPYYSSPYYSSYMNQYGGYGQGGYGGYNQGGGKGMYGQPHHYMSPQGSFDQHSSSPANAGGFGASSMHSRDSGLGGGLGEYGRSVSGASQNQHSATAGSSGFGGLQESYGRPQGGYGGQSSSYGQQQLGAQGGNTEDALKPFGGDKNSGSSPSALGAQSGRPGSATNNGSSQGQGGHPQQTQQQGLGGYPSHMQQGGQGNSQYGALGGLGHQGQHPSGNSHQQSGGYGNYGGFGGGGYGSYNRGGWGTNYGQH